MTHNVLFQIKHRTVLELTHTRLNLKFQTLHESDKVKGMIKPLPTNNENSDSTLF